MPLRDRSAVENVGMVCGGATPADFTLSDCDAATAATSVRPNSAFRTMTTPPPCTRLITASIHLNRSTDRPQISLGRALERGVSLAGNGAVWKRAVDSIEGIRA